MNTMKELEFTMNFQEMRLLFLHRSNYRSRLTKRIRKLFKRLRLKNFFDHYAGNVVELYDYLFCRNSIWRAHKTEMMGVLDTMKTSLPTQSRSILDIGSGFGAIDLLLFHHYEGAPNIHLLDKDDIAPHKSSGFHDSAESFAPYNSFAYTRSFLERNGVPGDKIATTDIATETFPQEEQFDLVLSLLAWGFHFPVSTYIDDVYNTLSPGGTLIMDVRKTTHGIDELEQKFGHRPTVIYEEEKFSRVSVQKNG